MVAKQGTLRSVGRFPRLGERRRAGALVAVLVLIGALALPVAAVSPLPHDLPVQVAEEDWASLWDRGDAALQARLDAAIEKRPAWAKLVRSKRMAVGLVDLSDPSRPRFATVNGSHMMYAASLPKIGILLAAYVGMEEGWLEEDDDLHALLAQMIRVSSNSAATAVMDMIGFERLGEVLSRPDLALYDRKHGGGLWVGKRYAKEGRRYPDPLAGISHGATATQVCRFYYLLATGRVINDERSRQMLGDLADPGLHHKFVSVLERRAPLARLFRKSGTWRTWHSDSVLVWGPEWRRYILVTMVESADGEAILREMVPVAESVLGPPRVARAAYAAANGRPIRSRSGSVSSLQ